MGLVVDYGGLLVYSRVRIRVVKTVSSSQSVSRLQVLEQVDKHLEKGDERLALSLVKDLQGKPGGFLGFGAARQIPQRLYSLDELKLNGIVTQSILSPTDTTLGSIERALQLAAVSGGLSAWAAFGFTQQQILFLSLGFLFLWSVDAHEAGHFLIAYLLGVLPKGYSLSSLEALRKEGSLNVQAGTTFVDFEFLEEVNTGKVSAKMLNRFSCIALAGVATEYTLFGYSEGGLADIYQLDGLLKSLGFTQKKADSQVRWAVLNTILILRRHEKARSELAEAMSMGSSVGFCIQAIEKAIDVADI
ncbi:uncharacterized protein LOC122658841 isoform X2 [Telopea speciosissima]|uniref:uncharacterized protein LOC122658841 isoform X2 n=1 Tax=Telopea speciosissima TaxID=54955 RepID=UPI001CC427A0|nr:uncharacterized protein LOC122658841 isoform X2 [Telopea speciosissima]